MSRLFPLFLRLDGRRCVLVGAGTIASQKITGLIDAGAHVHVIAPQAGPEISELIRGGVVCWSQRVFRPDDLEGSTLVIAATGDAEANECVFREARRRGVLCNAVDDPDRCDFYYPAIVKRGDLQIAISTAGNSPALAQRIRTELEGQFGEEYSPWLSWLGDARLLLFQRSMDPAQRRAILHRIASREVYERYVSFRQRKGTAK